MNYLLAGGRKCEGLKADASDRPLGVESVNSPVIPIASVAPPPLFGNGYCLPQSRHSQREIC